MTIKTSQSMPDSQGFFGPFAGQFIPPELKTVMDEITQSYQTIREMPEFQQELAELFQYYVGRPSSLYFAKRLSKKHGGAKTFLNVRTLITRDP